MALGRARCRRRVRFGAVSRRRTGGLFAAMLRRLAIPPLTPAYTSPFRSKMHVGAPVVLEIPCLCCAYLCSSSSLLVMEKLQVRSLWVAHLMSWTAFIMVLVWALAYQVRLFTSYP